MVCERRPAPIPQIPRVVDVTLMKRKRRNQESSLTSSWSTKRAEAKAQAEAGEGCVCVCVCVYLEVHLLATCECNIQVCVVCVCVCVCVCVSSIWSALLSMLRFWTETEFSLSTRKCVRVCVSCALSLWSHSASTIRHTQARAGI